MSNDGHIGNLRRRDVLAGGVSAGALATLAPLSSSGASAQVPSGIPMKAIIDVHSHAVLPSWQSYLVKKNAPKPPTMEGVSLPEWSPEMAITVMDQHSIQTMVLSIPIGTKGMTCDEAVPLARTMNREFAQIVKENPRRFGAFAVLPLQDIDASIAEIGYAMDTLGLDGVCLPTSFEGAYFGDPRFDKIFAELDRRKATVFVHPHGPAYVGQINMPVVPAMVEFVFDSTRALVSLICSGVRRRYPNFKYIASHGGGTLPFVAGRVSFITTLGKAYTGYDAQLTYQEAMDDMRSIHYDLALTSNREALISLRALVPADNIVMGFDFPFVSDRTIQPASTQIVSSGVFTEAELATIAGTNARKILPTLAARLDR